MSSRLCDLLIMSFRIFKQLAVNVNCFFVVSALRIGDGDLIDDLRLVRTIQMAVDLLQVKPGHCLSDSFHQHRKLFLRTVVPLLRTEDSPHR